MKRSLRYVAYGECPNCGAQIIRQYDCTVGVCDCKNPYVEVPLKPTMLFRANSRLYRKIEKIAEMVGVSVEAFVTKIFDLALDNEEFLRNFLKQVRGGSKTCRNQ